uniref:Uncharacterized protein n=1 Tax=Tanacetum cinerariifolium TaxID=118510 RepID=A0A699HW41_TANCI|nr:hypothetical protein [Tanacetum cinerariifolium]
MSKASSQPQSSYEAAATLTEFELKKILIDKINSSESYLTAPEHQECYDGLIKSYNLDKDFFSSYDVYLLKRSQDDKDKSQPKSSGKSVHTEEPEFKVGDTNTPQGQEWNQGNDNDEPKTESASRCVWFTKPSCPQEPTDPDWNEGKTPQTGPTQNWLTTLAASTSTGKSLKEFDELMSTPIDFSSYILNGLKIKNITQEILLGPALRLLKGTRSNYAELEYDFEECYKALSEKLDWENPKGGGIPTMTYTTSTTKTKATQYDLPGIEDMVPNIWSPVKVAYDKYALWGISHWRDQRKTFYAYARGIQSRGDVYSIKRILAVTQVSNRLTNMSGDDVADFAITFRMFTKSLVIQKRVEDLQLGVESYQKQINVTKPNTTRLDLRKRHPYTPYKNPQGFIYVDDYQRNKLMRSDELHKFSDGTLTRLLSSFEDITKNIDIEYLPKRRWAH